MPEREQRRRVDGADFVTAGRAARRGRSTAGSRTRTGSCTGRRPDGLTRPVSTSASACAPSSPGKNPHTTAASRSAWREMSYGRPTSSTSTTGVPVASRASSSSSWRPGSRRSVASQPSPDVPRPNSPARSPRTTTQTSASRGDLRRGGDLRVVAAEHRAALREGDVGSPSRSASSTVGASIAHRHLGMVRADVDGERVAAHQRVRRRPRAARRPRPAPAGEPAAASPSFCSSTIDRSASSRGERPRSGVVEVGRPASAARARSPASSRPSSHFCSSTRSTRPVDQRLVDVARLDRLRAAARRSSRRRAARRRCPPRSASPPRRRRDAGDAVQRLQERDREVVGDDRAGEAPGVAQQAGEQRRVGGDRHAVDVGVGVHHRARRRARSAISNGGSSTSASSRGPIDTGARLRPAREAE